MKIAALSIADYCEATDGMPHDVERLYFRMLLKMYSREGGLPDDDKENARIFGYDVRTYRRLKAKLIGWPNALYIEGDEIRNGRVDNAVQEHKERRKAAAINGQIGGKSKRSRAEVRPKSGQSPPEVRQKSTKIVGAGVSKNNDLAEPSPSPSPTPSPKEVVAAVDSHALYERLLEAADGALCPLAVGLQSVGEPLSWLAQGASLDLDVVPTVRALAARARPQSIRSWGYFAGAVADAKARRERPLPAGNPFAAPPSDMGESLRILAEIRGMSPEEALAYGRTRQ